MDASMEEGVCMPLDGRKEKEDIIKKKGAMSIVRFCRNKLWSFALFFIFSLLICVVSGSSAKSTDSPKSVNWSTRIPGRKFDDSVGMDESIDGWSGFGREFDLFDSRRGGASSPSSSSSYSFSSSASSLSSSSQSSSPPSSSDSSGTSNASSSGASRRNFPYDYSGVRNNDDNDASSSGEGIVGSVGDLIGSSNTSSSSWLKSKSSIMNRRFGNRGSGSASSAPRFSATATGSSSKKGPFMFQIVQDWWTTTITPNVKNWPKIQCRVEPTTTLKIRKTFRPLKTIVKLGADFNTQLGVWQFKSSWEDAIIGGKLTLAGRELQLTKSWQISVGAVEDLVTRFRFRAAVDLQTWKAYARVGFRTERLSPINVVEGFTLLKQLPLDGYNGHVKLEVKANFALPEPEIEYSTESQRSLVGMGNVEVNIDELNLLLDY